MEKIKQTNMPPNYQKIYTDMILKKFPEKMNECSILLKKNNFGMVDVLKLNKILFPDPKKAIFKFNQQHNAYDRESILTILNYQKVNKLSNTQVANHFKLSRNTVAKWKKLFND